MLKKEEKSCELSKSRLSEPHPYLAKSHRAYYFRRIEISPSTCHSFLSCSLLGYWCNIPMLTRISQNQAPSLVIPFVYHVLRSVVSRSFASLSLLSFSLSLHLFSNHGLFRKSFRLPRSLQRARNRKKKSIDWNDYVLLSIQLSYTRVYL